MNKSVITNLVALTIVIIGSVIPIYSNVIVMTGLFALSGAMTNWLAIHMLFEKVPLLYGSGVIPNRFEEFKSGIRQLVIKEFFTHARIGQFFKQNNQTLVTTIQDRIDFDQVFEDLTDVIQTSSVGSILGMLGGKTVLQSLKEPTIKKLQEIISDLVTNQSIKHHDNNFTAFLIQQIEKIIERRMKELTPEQVKHIMQDMIQKHLGWLVVWGGALGGIIGFSVSLIDHLN